LPETGVCSTDLDDEGGSCCGTATNGVVQDAEVKIGGCCDDTSGSCCVAPTPQLITLTRR
jgi:hypothetical protein